VEDAMLFISILADHPERWSALGAASLERVQTHSIESIVDRYEALYRDVLAR
jgi:glycosyltransferase involved in cell wall biosynthesis